MSSSYYVRRQAKIHGPFSSSQVRTLAKVGKLQADDELSTDQCHWTMAARVKGLSFTSRSAADASIAKPRATVVAGAVIANTSMAEASCNRAALAMSAATPTHSDEVFELTMRRQPFVGRRLSYLLRFHPEQLTVQLISNGTKNPEIVLTRSQAAVCVRLPIDARRIVISVPQGKKLVLEHKRTTEYLEMRERIGDWLAGRPWKPIAAHNDEQLAAKQKQQGKQQLRIAKLVAGTTTLGSPLLIVAGWDKLQTADAFFMILQLTVIIVGFIGLTKEKSWAAILLASFTGLVLLVEVAGMLGLIVTGAGVPWLMHVRLLFVMSFLVTFVGAARYLLAERNRVVVSQPTSN